MTTKTRNKKPKTDFENRLKWIRKNKTPRYVLEVELDYFENDLRKVLAISDELRIIRNTVVGQLYKNYKQMSRTKKYKSLIIISNENKKKINSLNKQSKSYEEDLEILTKESEDISKKFEKLRGEYNLTFEFARKMSEALNKNKFLKPDAVTTWSACEIAFKSIERIMYNDAKRPRFLSKGQYLPLQGKQAERCVIIKKDKKTDGWFIKTQGMKFNLKINPKDLFLLETLSNIENYINHSDEIDKKLVENYNLNKEIINTHRVCNNRIVIKEIRGKKRLFVQITIEGIPAPKRKKDGSFRHSLGKGTIGGDIGTQSLAVSTENVVILKNLAERSNKSTFELERKISNLQRALDRSKRIMNPNNYNEDGTIKKGRKEWVKSNRYKKIQLKYRELHRKASLSRKYAINEDVNYLRSLGDNFIIERMNIKGLQKKAKNITKNEKGKFNRRKRYGKSIENRCPGYLISQSKNKFKVTGGTVNEVNTWTFKASQYDHKLDSCSKKSLSKRWHIFEDGTKVQRDIYSSFLLLCSNKEFNAPNKELCDKLFEQFLINHDKCINEIKQNRIKVLNSGIKIS
ncbi:MAG: hypothetical protein IJH34_10085 [Romboutsia sp.]|nr:hypothetical protein [Romboutsia sp.]